MLHFYININIEQLSAYFFAIILKKSIKGESLKSIQRIIIRSLLLFYLTSSYLSAIHIHNNALEQPNECKVCIILKNLHGGDASPLEYHITDIFDYYSIVIFSKSHYSLFTDKGFNSHAPPLFS